ncbi:DUF5134 domain-containing protein [Streptomyces sp. HPF1205]|uniref:DUF5134 domain-containing protein n=1 Tax=Streptomyces sp. HPF1205 TaxID=2873262 RepID=UPI0027DEFC09|nr:DUF5134 domain-containing protein [Streptomyces sp. HPF1205]
MTCPVHTPVDVVRCMLTVLFASAALHALLHGARTPGMGRRDRVDHLLHFATAVVMAAMPWGLGRSLSGPTTTVLLMAGALWFPLTAVHRRTGESAAMADRLPPAAGMAAMAWMLWTPHMWAVPSHETPAGSGPGAHHFATVDHAASVPATADVVTGLLTAYLLACGVRWLNPMPHPTPAADTARRRAATHDPYGHLRDGAMALGTAVMLLMPH